MIVDSHLLRCAIHRSCAEFIQQQLLDDDRIMRHLLKQLRGADSGSESNVVPLILGLLFRYLNTRDGEQALLETRTNKLVTNDAVGPVARVAGSRRAPAERQVSSLLLLRSPLSSPSMYFNHLPISTVSASLRRAISASRKARWSTHHSW